MVVVSPWTRGRGYGAAMIQDALTVAFSEMAVHRVDLGVYERLGFQREGVHRDVTLANGQWWSSLTMSLLDHEWRTRRN
jgi:RimJ/RimL family protein N-acetyltransferase